jgi:hypothetical protein
VDSAEKFGRVNIESTAWLEIATEDVCDRFRIFRFKVMKWIIVKDEMIICDKAVVWIRHERMDVILVR